ncbi:hypothetical protein KGY73_10175 [bacterium]|nr:hypothetical protein [bacterium]
MDKDFNQFTIHKKMEILVEEMIEKEIPLKEAVNEFKKVFIQIASKKYKGNKTQMARALGVHRNTLSNLTKNLKK